MKDILLSFLCKIFELVGQFSKKSSDTKNRRNLYPKLFNLFVWCSRILCYFWVKPILLKSVNFSWQLFLLFSCANLSYSFDKHGNVWPLREKHWLIFTRNVGKSLRVYISEIFFQIMYPYIHGYPIKYTLPSHNLNMCGWSSSVMCLHTPDEWKPAMIYCNYSKKWKAGWYNVSSFILATNE